MTLWVGFDVETVGDEPAFALQPWRATLAQHRRARIRSFAYASKQGAHAILDPTRYQLSEWLMFQAERGNIIVCSETKFDVAFLLAIGLKAEVYANKWMDFQLLWKRVDAHRFAYGLKTAVAEFLPQLAGYDEGIDFNATDPEEVKKLLTYNKVDAVATVKLAQIFWEQLEPEERTAALIEGRGIPMIAESWITRIRMDADALVALDKELSKERLRALYDLNALLEDQGLNEVTEEQISSPQQLGRLMFQDWGLQPIKVTPKGKPSTDKESLIKLAVQDEKVAQVHRVRKARHKQTRCVTRPLESLAYNGMSTVHPEPKIAETYTGRMTYKSNQGKGKNLVQTGIALHQWDRGATVRETIQGPEGYKLVEFDWSGQEMRLMADRMAVLCGDETMLNLFLDGKDLHSYMGAQIKQVEYDWLVENKNKTKDTKAIRDLGKFANLSLQYRVGNDTMRARALTQYNLWLTAQDAKQIKMAYFRGFPGVEAYWGQAIALAKQFGYCETMGHRRVKLDNLSIYSQQQTAINTPIQGTGGDMKHLGLAVVSSVLLKMCGLYAFDLHDALFVYLPDNSELESNVLDLRYRLTNLPYKKMWNWEPTLPLTVDASVGDRWGHLKEVK